MNYVSYSRGTKEEYKQLKNKDRNTLYWCTDSKELLLGDNLYSDGLRQVEDYKSLPKPEEAAYGILYFCQKEAEGYTLQKLTNNSVQWKKVLSNSGEIYQSELTRISNQLKTLEESFTKFKNSMKDSMKFKGEVEDYSALLAIAAPIYGDLYILKNTKELWVRNSQSWQQLTTEEAQQVKIKLGTTILEAKDNIITLPTSSIQTLGIVRSSNMDNKILVNQDGTMEVNKISMQKINQEVNENVTLDCGNSILL